MTPFSIVPLPVNTKPRTPRSRKQRRHTQTSRRHTTQQFLRCVPPRKEETKHSRTLEARRYVRRDDYFLRSTARELESPAIPWESPAIPWGEALPTAP